MSIKIITPEAELYHRERGVLYHPFLETVFLPTLPPFRGYASKDF
jgi:hypothetical protein